MSKKMIPYVVAERNQNVAEVSADFLVLHNSSLILGSFVDISGKIKKAFADLIQGKSSITLRDRSNIFFENNIRTFDEKFKYKLNKHDSKNTHGVIHNVKQENYVFDWNGEGLVKSLTKYMSNKQYLPVTEDIVEKVLAKQTEYYSIVEECDIYSTQEGLSNVGVWYVNSTAFKQSLEQVDMEVDESFNWDEIEDISDYLVTFVDPIKEKLNKNIRVLYDENKIDEKMFEGEKKPYDGQIPLIQSGVQVLQQKDSRFVYLAAEMGVGKSFIASKINHLYHHEKGKSNYISLIVAPAITLTQWEDELRTAIAEDIDVKIIKNTNEFIRFHTQTKMNVDKPTYLLVGKETFKLSYKVRHGVIPVKRTMTIQEKTEYGWTRDVDKEIEVCLCSDCGKPLQNPLRKDTVFFTEKDFNTPKKSNYKCSECGGVLFQAVYDKTKKTSIINYMKKKNIRLDSVTIDEIHDAGNAQSLIGVSSRDVMKRAKKVILLSGTVSNGYASSVYNVLSALIPNQLKKDNVFDQDKFVKAYGTLLGKTKIKDSDFYKSSRIEVKDSSLQEIEGINPILYSRYLASSYIFTELKDVAGKRLPELKEEYVAIDVPKELQISEKRLMDDIEGASAFNASFYKDSVVKHYVNNPFNWKEIPFIFKEGSEKMDTFVQPTNLEKQILPKEKKLVEICKQEKENGRKTWVYTEFVTNGKYTTGINMQDRLKTILENYGLSVYVLKSNVPTIKRAEVINKAQKSGKYDVFLSHPQLISVGVNLQWCTNYVFYTPSYKVNTVKQSSKRGLRINSIEDNKIFHLYGSTGIEAEIMERYILKKMESDALEAKYDKKETGVKRTASGLGAKIEESLSKQVM
ncbi:hypothetical protein CIL05_07330 [Virgibacillus profundi]|uniref:Helicase ATP-binding domain-containing protein n=1 Tax=Virgibacillus profundi TaxID=2024555 RepID=A0A2A2IFE4_9BACI|nr:SNF2-related protein [Virgibacillus profundi]PAV30272.1 hypothetical protein CIL05_07330 [Virgibacillus profundi]PXY54444.1 hypothetical protein CIT14_07415 [Virgibacillus profundi]